MDDNQKNEDLSNDMNLRENREIRNEYERENRNKNVIIGVIIGSIVLVGLILYFALSGDESHYDRGMQYLRQKQYTEALVEFQKVETDEKEFRMAQSKINYIMGLRAFNDGLRQEAKVYLTKVEPTDEYYNETKLMIDKINSLTRQSELESLNQSLRNNKDTVIIQEKIVEVPTEKVDAAEPNATDSPSKTYSLGLQRIVNNFESSYESARTASSKTKNDYVRNMDSLYNEFIKWDNNLNEKTTTAMELKRLTNSWMQKRIDYINKLIDDASGKESTVLRSIKEEGDKEYSLLMSLLRK